MPFDPNKYLASKQATQADAPSAGDGFDPNQYLQSKGVQTLPDKGQIQDGASTADKLASNPSVQNYRQIANTASGSAGFGLGNQMNAGIQAAAGAVDQTVNGSNAFGDQSSPDSDLSSRFSEALSNLSNNYDRAKQSLNAENASTRAAHPIATAIAQIGASIAPSIVASQGLQMAGLKNIMGQAGLIGAGMSYGNSGNTGTAALKDAAEGGVIAAGTAGALQLAGKTLSAIKDIPVEDLAADEYSNYSAPVKDIANMTASESPYGLDLKVRNADAFKLGQEYKTALTNPQTQLQITQELNQQPQVVQSIIDKTQDTLGQLKAQKLAQVADVPVSFSDTDGGATKNLQDVFKSVRQNVDGIYTKGNPERENLKQALISQMNDTESAITSDSRAPDLTGATMKSLADQQSQLGDIIFKQKAFSGDSVVNGQAKRFFGALSNSLNKADEQVGTGGEISNINKVFSALYQMEDITPSGATIKSLTDPQAAGAQNKYSAFVKPFEDLRPDVRDALAPDMHDYLANQLPTTLAKAKTMLLATERGPQSAFAGKQLLSIAGLRNLSASGFAQAANIAGVVSSPISSGLGSIATSGANLYNAVAPAVAPGLGALATDNSQPNQTPALGTVK